MFLVRILRRTPGLKHAVYYLGKRRGAFLIDTFIGHIKPSDKLIDIGVGTGNVTARLKQLGHDITPVDVIDISFTNAVRPVIYDGKTLPWSDGQFDTALLITVLHHTSDPESVIAEAMRVADQIIIIEDVYTSRIHKYITYFMDSLLNLEFFGHPRSNRTDAAWQKTFADLGLHIKDVTAIKSYLVIKQRCYVLTKNGERSSGD